MTIMKRLKPLLLLLLVCLSLLMLFACGKNDSPTPEEPVDGLKFKLNDDKSSYYVAGIGTETGTEIVIPDTYNGKPVTAIGSLAFSCEPITSITIPDSVTTIRDNAFSGCSSLINITIPNSVTSIELGAFTNCSSLTGITIPSKKTLHFPVVLLSRALPSPTA